MRSLPPRVTVAMPARNAAPHIEEAVRSVLAQEGVAFELVIVDDASADRTPAILDGLDDVRVRCVRNDQPRGIGFSHNVALGLARGELLVHVDADDLLLPGALARAADEMDRWPRAAQAFANGYHVDANGALSEREEMRQRESLLRQRASLLRTRSAIDLHRTLLVHGMMATPLRTYRTAILREMGGFDETLRYAVDFEMTLRLADAHEIRYLPEFLYCQRIWDGNTQQTMRFRDLRSWRTRAGIALRLLRGRETLLGYSPAVVRALLVIGLLHTTRLTLAARALERLPGLGAE